MWIEWKILEERFQNNNKSTWRNQVSCNSIHVWVFTTIYWLYKSAWNNARFVIVNKSQCKVFTIHQKLCMMNKWWASKISVTETFLMLRYWPNSVNNRGWYRPVSNYIAHIVNEFRNPLTIEGRIMISMYKNALFKTSLSIQEVVLNFWRQKRVTEVKLLE